MSTVVDIILIVFIALGTYAGWRRGLIKSLVNLIGLVAVLIISYSLRVPVANFLIDKLPFLPFNGLTSLSILIYNILAFVFIFIILYCVLNIILSITGFIDTLLKFTVIYILPSKIGGAIVGFLEAWVFAFLVVFVLSSFSITAHLIEGSKVTNILLTHTPVISNYVSDFSNSAKEIYKTINTDITANNVKSLNFDVLMTLVNYNIITPEKAKELVDTGKLDLGDVQFVRPTVK